jgi:hypothetical protein
LFCIILYYTFVKELNVKLIHTTMKKQDYQQITARREDSKRLMFLALLFIGITGFVSLVIMTIQHTQYLKFVELIYK